MDGLNVLQKLGRGHLIDEIHAAILDVAEEVAATGKKGSVTVTLSIARAVPNGDPTLIVVHEEVKRTPPKGDPKGAMFWALDAELHDRDPRSPELPSFRVVDEGQGAELRIPDEPDQEAREVSQ